MKKRYIFSAFRWIQVSFMFLSFLPALESDPWALSGWRSRICLSNFSVTAGASLTDFPVLVRLTNQVALRSARADGGDLTFVDPSGLQLFHEIESFDGTSGDLVAWVCVPALTAATRLYLYFSNASANLPFDGSNATTRITTNLASLSTRLLASNVWDSNFKVVYHFAELSGTPVDSSRNGIVAASTGTSNRPGTNGPIGKALATVFPVANNQGSTVPVQIATNDLGPSPTSISYSLWANFNSPAGYISSGFIELFTYYSGGSSTGVLCIRMDPNANATMTTYKASAQPTKFTNFGNWNYFAGGGTLFTSTTGTNWGMTNGAVVGANATSVAMISNNSPGSYLTLGAYPYLSYYHPNGGYDEFRLSYTNRETTWMATEYANATQGANLCLLEPPEYAEPQPTSPIGGLVTNATVEFSWTPGRYRSSLTNHRILLLSNGTVVQSTNTGTNLAGTLTLPAFGNAVVTNFYQWAVQAALNDGSTLTSATNGFSAALFKTFRIFGIVSRSNGSALGNVYIQNSQNLQSNVVSQTDGSFDLGRFPGGQSLEIRFWPSARLGVESLKTNLAVGSNDLDLRVTLLGTPLPTGQTVRLVSNASYFVKGSSDGLSWSLPRRPVSRELCKIRIHAIPVAGGSRILLADDYLVATGEAITIPGTVLERNLLPGIYYLEAKIFGSRLDDQSATVQRSLFFFAR